MSDTEVNSDKSIDETIQSNKGKLLKQFLRIAAGVVLIILSFCLPLFGEHLQKEYIGEEDYCCAMSVVPDYVKYVEHARSLHWLSDLIIGGSLIAAIILCLVGSCLVYSSIYRNTKQGRKRTILITIVSIPIVPIMFLLISTMFYYSTNNYDYYHSYRTHAPVEPIYFAPWKN